MKKSFLNTCPIFRVHHTTALPKGDVTALDPIYSNDFLFINAQGKMNKTERLAYLKVNNPESFAFENEDIRIYGNTAVINTDVKIKPKGRAIQKHFNTIVMVKMDGHWKEVQVNSISAQGVPDSMSK